MVIERKPCDIIIHTSTNPLTSSFYKFNLTLRRINRGLSVVEVEKNKQSWGLQILTWSEFFLERWEGAMLN